MEKKLEVIGGQVGCEIALSAVADAELVSDRKAFTFPELAPLIPVLERRRPGEDVAAAVARLVKEADELLMVESDRAKARLLYEELASLLHPERTTQENDDGTPSRDVLARLLAERRDQINAVAALRRERDKLREVMDAVNGEVLALREQNQVLLAEQAGAAARAAESLRLLEQNGAGRWLAAQVLRGEMLPESANTGEPYLVDRDLRKLAAGLGMPEGISPEHVLGWVSETALACQRELRDVMTETSVATSAASTAVGRVRSLLGILRERDALITMLRTDLKPLLELLAPLKEGSEDPRSTLRRVLAHRSDVQRLIGDLAGRLGGAGAQLDAALREASGWEMQAQDHRDRCVQAERDLAEARAALKTAQGALAGVGDVRVEVHQGGDPLSRHVEVQLRPGDVFQQQFPFSAGFVVVKNAGPVPPAPSEPQLLKALCRLWRADSLRVEVRRGDKTEVVGAHFEGGSKPFFPARVVELPHGG